jgi:hypothetical protein
MAAVVCCSGWFGTTISSPEPPPRAVIVLKVIRIVVRLMERIERYGPSQPFTGQVRF